MKLLVAVLTSQNSAKLDRCIESVFSQTENVVVVCNTLDTAYVDEAAAVAQKYDIPFIVTESNGTPAKGKNSVLDYFRTTEYDFFMQVDGDDSLAPNCINKLRRIVYQYGSSNVDVVGLTNNYMIYDGKETTAEDFFESKDIYSFAGIKGSHGLRLIQLGKFLANNLVYNRMVLYSRKCLDYLVFDEKFLGSEDVVASYKLYYNNDINYVLTDEHLYVYDLEDTGNFHSFLSSSSEIKKVLIELEKIVNEFQNRLANNI